MALNDILGKFVRPLGLVAALYGCGGDTPQGCKVDNDCHTPYVCVQAE